MSMEPKERFEGIVDAMAARRATLVRGEVDGRPAALFEGDCVFLFVDDAAVFRLGESATLKCPCELVDLDLEGHWYRVSAEHAQHWAQAALQAIRHARG